MKKTLVYIFIVALMLTCLTSCDIFNGLFEQDEGLTYNKYENCAIFTFDDFEGKSTIELARTDLDEGAIYYQANLEEGALAVKYKDTGYINNEQQLVELTADEEMPVNGSGGYVEKAEINITFEAYSPVSGEIIIAFTESALKAVHKDLQLHEHTCRYETTAEMHKKIYTCDCDWLEKRDWEPHYDDNNNDLCDECSYEIPHTEHTTELTRDEFTHCEVYTCGCPTPPNAAPHLDDDGNGRCDVCDYVMRIDHTEHTTELTWDEFCHSTVYTCGCTSPSNAAPHFDDDGDGKCDVCEYYILPEENHFLRNQIGTEWIRDITADDIAKIKIISQDGMVAAGCFKYISSSDHKATIERMLESYYWLDLRPVDEEKTIVCDGGLVMVCFIMNDGTVKEIKFNNGEFYMDANGSHYELFYLPVFSDTNEYKSYYAFETNTGTGVLGKLLDGGKLDVEPVILCEIPMDDIEFTETLPHSIAVEPIYCIETDFGYLMFVDESVFYIKGNKDVYYELIGKTLDELIVEY